MFRETVTNADGTTAEGTATEAHALALLRTAARRGFTIEATQTGGVIITRQVWSGSVLPRRHTVALEPVLPAGKLTPTRRQELERLANCRDAYRVDATEPEFRDRRGRLYVGLFTIPPATTARLVERGLVVLGEPYPATSNGYMAETRTPVRVSLAARLALLAQAHHTSTREPRGYHRPDLSQPYASIGRNVGGGKAGLLYDGTSAASCSCGGWSVTVDSRDEARRRAHEHRAQATAELVATLV